MRSIPIILYIPEDRQSMRYKVYKIVVTKGFDSFITFLVIANSVVLMMGYFDQPTEYEYWMNQLNSSFNYFFTLELILKLFAYHLDYFYDGWNVFDFIIVLGSWADFAIGVLGKKHIYDII